MTPSTTAPSIPRSHCRRAGGLALAALLALAPWPAVTLADAGALSRALHFLERSQLGDDLDVQVGERRVRDYAGGWPQYFRLAGVKGLRVRDVSPFTTAFIHHALALVNRENRHALGLAGGDLERARRMRRRAVAYLERFRSRAPAADAGTYGFWPLDAYPGQPGPGLGVLLTAWLKGPILGGERVPLNLAIFPDTLAIPTDADVTAAALSVLLDDARLDGGPGPRGDFGRFFTDWRDTGAIPRRARPAWPPEASGAFLTWLGYREPGQAPVANDVDLIVNANVLHALGLAGLAHLPGVAEASALIREATALGLHRDRLETLTDYYPDSLVYHYAVSRAFHEGGIRDLAPAVRTLAAELAAEARSDPAGSAPWDRGAPQLNTAFALLTLLNAGVETPLAPRAAAYLERQQGPRGGYDAATFFVARNDGGQEFEFFSRAFTTAMVLEALARFRLQAAGIR